MKPSELRADVGQLIIMGFIGQEMTSALRVVLGAMQPGGIILFARNIAGAEQTWKLVHACREGVRETPFLCVDLEGGTVDRLKEVIAPAPAAAEVFATGKSKLFRRHGRVIGEQVRALGFNTDFAPVFDLKLPPSQSVLTTRTVSADPNETVAYAREFLRGLEDARVLGCGKHFPGLGEASLDTHHELPSIRKSFKELWQQDLVPYRELRKQVPFCMVAHANYPEVTGDTLPASLSRKWMEGILRDKIGYRGIILADDLEMGGVLAAASIGDAAIQTLRAGSDMFLVCHNEEHVWKTFEAVLREAERDKGFAKLVTKRAKRVRDLKKRSRELRGEVPAPTEKTVQKLKDAMADFREDVAKAVARA
jgi:beta-N-acetylhexosaminidase